MKCYYWSEMLEISDCNITSANCCQLRLVIRHLPVLMTSQVVVSYVIEACLFHTLLSCATVSSRCRRQFCEGNFTDECYQMLLCDDVIGSSASVPARCETIRHCGTVLFI